MDHSIERDMDRRAMERRGWRNPEGAEWHRPLDQRIYDRGSRIDQGGYRRGRGTHFDYEERFRPDDDFRVERHESDDRGRSERRMERGDDRYGYVGPEEAYERRYEPGRFAGTNTYGPADAHRYDADRPGRVYGGSASGNLMRGMDPTQGPHAGKGPKGYRRSDAAIHEDVCEALTRHGEIDASDIELAVRDGEVTLEGIVNDRRTKRMAEDVAERVRGVHDVHNRLRLRSSLREADEDRSQMEGGEEGTAGTKRASTPSTSKGSGR